MDLYLATTRADWERMWRTRRLRSLVDGKGAPCGCRLPLRLYASREAAVAHPNARGAPTMLVAVARPESGDTTIQGGLRISLGGDEVKVSEL